MTSTDSNCVIKDDVNIMLPAPPSKKWVTFDDLIDDAMESGKLTPRRRSSEAPHPRSIEGQRRRSSVSSGALSSSVSSDGSWTLNENATAGNGSTSGNVRSHRKVDFSQSLGTENSSSLQIKPLKYLKQLEKKSLSNDALSQEDKYSSAFASLRSKKPDQTGTSPAQGWSKKLIHGSGKTGWSDEILGESDDVQGCYSSSGGEEEVADLTRRMRPMSLEVEEEQPWYGTTWTTSPSRVFVRNFP